MITRGLISSESLLYLSPELTISWRLIRHCRSMESIMAVAAPGVLVRTTVLVATFLALFVQRSHGAGGAVWLNAHATFYGASDGGGTMGIISFSLLFNMVLLNIVKAITA